MPVLKEFACKAHGPFEAQAADGDLPRCPKGCSKRFVSREFRTAPAHLGERTKNSDRTLRNLAADFRMTDIKNDKAGGSVMDSMKKAPLKASWGDVPKNANSLTDLGLGKNASNLNIFDQIGKPPAPKPAFQARDTGGYSTDVKPI